MCQFEQLYKAAVTKKLMLKKISQSEKYENVDDKVIHYAIDLLLEKNMIIQKSETNITSNFQNNFRFSIDRKSAESNSKTHLPDIIKNIAPETNESERTMKEKQENVHESVRQTNSNEGFSRSEKYIKLWNKSTDEIKRQSEFFFYFQCIIQILN